MSETETWHYEEKKGYRVLFIVAKFFFLFFSTSWYVKALFHYKHSCKGEKKVTLKEANKNVFLKDKNFSEQLANPDHESILLEVFGL